VYTFIACAAQASREQMCQMRTTHAQTISPIWSRRVSSFFYGRYGKFNKDVYGVPMNSHNRITETHRENQRNTDTDREMEGQTETQTQRQRQTHTWEAGVRHVGHILVVLIMREAQSLHTHRCPHGVNKCDCMLPHHYCE
jgi:hypothetical protein